MRKREEDLRSASGELLVCRQDLEAELGFTKELREEVGKGVARITELETQVSGFEAQISKMRQQNQDLEVSLEEIKSHLATKDDKLAELQKEVAEAEFVRRKLHNMIQELKGNIRVFCRVRPILPSDAPASSEEVAADINFPDPDSETPNTIQLTSSTPAFSGPPRKETHTFSFDRVFPPESYQAQVFEEIELLVQSCVDGFNVCVFAYGQTGSGKSWTMEGGSVSDSFFKSSEALTGNTYRPRST
jgi:kinesin family protein C1